MVQFLSIFFLGFLQFLLGFSKVPIFLCHPVYLFLFSTCFGQPCAHHQENLLLSTRHWCLSFCMGGIWSAPTSRPDAGLLQPADQMPPIQWQIPLSHRYSKASWWWAHGCLKHVVKRNKYTKQNCTPSWIYLQAWALTVCTLYCRTAHREADNTVTTVTNHATHSAVVNPTLCQI